MGKIEEFTEHYQKNLKKLQKKYKKMKRKYFLLFVLPVFLIIVMFQAVKQILKIKARELGEKASADGTEEQTADS